MGGGLRCQELAWLTVYGRLAVPAREFFTHEEGKLVGESLRPSLGHGSIVFIESPQIMAFMLPGSLVVLPGNHPLAKQKIFNTNLYLI